MLKELPAIQLPANMLSNEPVFLNACSESTNQNISLTWDGGKLKPLQKEVQKDGITVSILVLQSQKHAIKG